MCRRRATSTASMSGLLERNVGYVTLLRIKIRKLEEEADELSQRLNMLLADVDENMARNNDLRLFQLQVEQQVQLQEALNYSLEEEIRQLRELLEQEAPAQAEAQPQEGRGGGAATTKDDEAAAEGK